MRISILTPSAPRSYSGNWNTASRWARLLRRLGHRVTVDAKWNGKPADVLVALHARRSHESIVRFTCDCPGRPLVLALTGTDLYRDIRTDRDAQESIELASRLIVLQPMGLRELQPAVRKKTTVIHQSCRNAGPQSRLRSCFEVVVSGHLRDEKDPFRAAAALAYLPAISRIRVTHLGDAISPDMAETAQRWMEQEPRYRWLGKLPHGRALRLLARGRLMVISSRLEGGANVVSEALAAGVPVVASRISGNLGMLGSDYRGYYAPGDERSLARVLWRAESNSDYYQLLRRQCIARRNLVDPKREQLAWKKLLADLAAT